jgi:hypothetical protein
VFYAVIVALVATAVAALAAPSLLFGYVPTTQGEAAPQSRTAVSADTDPLKVFDASTTRSTVLDSVPDSSITSYSSDTPIRPHFAETNYNEKP